MPKNYIIFSREYKVPVGDSCKFPDWEPSGPYACDMLDSYDNRCMVFCRDLQFDREGGRAWLKCDECLKVSKEE